MTATILDLTKRLPADVHIAAPVGQPETMGVCDACEADDALYYVMYDLPGAVVDEHRECCDHCVGRVVDDAYGRGARTVTVDPVGVTA